MGKLSFDKVAPWTVLSAVVVLAATFIFRHPQPVIQDQMFIFDKFGGAGHPGLDTGVLSTYLAMLVRLLLSFEGVELDTMVRIVAMAMYVFAAFLLAQRTLNRSITVMLAMTVLLTSQYPFIYLSTELFAGAFMCLSMVAMVSAWPPLVVGAILALTPHTKPDLLLPAVLFAVLQWRALEGSRARVQLASAFGLGLIVPALPGFIIHGSDYLGSGRALMSLTQHYAWLTIPHQWAFDGSRTLFWYQEADLAVSKTFPGAHSVFDVVTMYPLRYAEFVALSLARGGGNFLGIFGVAALLFPAAIVLKRRGVVESRPYDTYVLASLVGLIPMIALSFPRVRYLARFYPLLLLFILATGERLAEKHSLNKNHYVTGAYLAIFGWYMGSLALGASERWASLLVGQIYWAPELF